MQTAAETAAPAPPQLEPWQDDFSTIYRSGQFDHLWYAARYPDVGLTDLSPLEHYVKYGARLGRLLVHPQQDLAPDHQFGEPVAAGGGRFDVGDHLAPAHHGDRVGQVHDLAELVGDDDDRLALIAQRPEDAE